MLFKSILVFSHYSSVTDSSLISFWSESILFYLYLLRYVLWPRMWSVLWMFHVSLRKMCILLLLEELFYLFIFIVYIITYVPFFPRLTPSPCHSHSPGEGVILYMSIRSNKLKVLFNSVMSLLMFCPLISESPIVLKSSNYSSGFIYFRFM